MTFLEGTWEIWSYCNEEEQAMWGRKLGFDHSTGCDEESHPVFPASTIFCQSWKHRYEAHLPAGHPMNTARWSKKAVPLNGCPCVTHALLPHQVQQSSPWGLNCVCLLIWPEILPQRRRLRWGVPQPVLELTGEVMGTHPETAERITSYHQIAFSPSQNCRTNADREKRQL